MRSTWPGQNVTQVPWMIHIQPTYDPVAHYMYIQDMLRTVLAFQVTTLYTYQSTMLHSAHQ